MAVKLQKSQMLASAVFNDNIRDAEKELEDGADPNLILPLEGIAPLHYAVGMASQKSLLFTKMLLGYGADPNIRSVDGLTPVHIAATWGRFQALEYLLASGGDPGLTDEEGQTALDMAESCDKWDCVDLLQAEGGETDKVEDPEGIMYTITGLNTSSFQRTDPLDAVNSILQDISDGYEDQIHSFADLGMSGGREHPLPFINYDPANLAVTDVHKDYDHTSSTADCSIESQNLPHENQDVQGNTDLHVSGQGDNTASAISPDHFTSSSTLDYSNYGILAEQQVSEHDGFHISGERGTRLSQSGDSLISDCAGRSGSVIPPNYYCPSGYGDWRETTETTHVSESEAWEAEGASCAQDPGMGLSSAHAVAGILKGNNDNRRRRKMRVSFFQNISKDDEDVAAEDDPDVPPPDENELEVNERLEHSQEGDTTLGEQSSCQEYTLMEGQGLDVTSPDNTVVFRKRASRDKRKTCFFEVIGSPYLSPADCSIHSKDGDTSQTLKEACTLLEELAIGHESPGDMLSRVKGIARSLRSGEPSPTSSVRSGDSSIPGNDHDNFKESSPCLSGETTPSRQSDGYVPRSEKKCRSSMFRHLSPVRDDCLPCDDDEVEEYFYYDREADARLIERNLPSANSSMRTSTNHSMVHDHFPRSANNSLAADHTRSSDETNLYDWKSFVSEESEEPEPDPILDEVNVLSNAEIQARLRALGEEPGPVTGTTRRVYLILLSKLIRDPERRQQKEAPKSSFKHELAQVLSGAKPLEDLSILEAEMVAQFITPDPRRKWREGVLKSSFNYLLLDPRVSLNLPMRHTLLSQLEVFRVFVSAIFYVGKGKRSRPYMHFYEALDKDKEGKKKKKPPGKKVKHIQEIWSAGLGVISLHIFQNTIPVEAYTREACMVEALTLQRLTNIKKGDYYGVASTWNTQKKRKMGTHLLMKACNIFLIEGERMIRPADIKVGQ